MTKPLNDFSTGSDGRLDKSHGNSRTTEEEWEAAAKRLGLGVDELKAQVKLADSIIEEILKEERGGNDARLEGDASKCYARGSVSGSF